MSNIKWAQLPWHCYVREFFPYGPELADDHEPRPGLTYCEHSSWVFYSKPTDEDIESLSDQARNGAKLMRWQLQHFTDRHANKLEALLMHGLLTEPDPSEINLAMVAYRHWQLAGHKQVAKILVTYMLQTGSDGRAIAGMLCENGQRRWDYLDIGFDEFVRVCDTELRYKNLSVALKEKGSVEMRKVKI